MAIVDNEFVAPGDLERTARLLQVIGERTVIKGSRVLDLACRTGVFARALSERGAHSIGIEGRPENLAMIPEYAAQNDSGDTVLCREFNPAFELRDVRDVSRDMYGLFDITLCMGILYHLGADDAFNLLRAMREMTTGFVVVDTHIGFAHDIAVINGKQYVGNWYGEPPGMWSSIGNDRSFWFSHESLTELMHDAGWGTVERVEPAHWENEPGGREWIVLS